MRIFVAFLTTIVFATAAYADSLQISVQSNHPNIVSLEFYSQDGNRAWPGDGQAYILDDSQVHDFNLQCFSGEQICYGAWVRGSSSTYWGVGQGDRQSCSSCCFRCGGGSTRVQVLNP